MINNNENQNTEIIKPILELKITIEKLDSNDLLNEYNVHEMDMMACCCCCCCSGCCSCC